MINKKVAIIISPNWGDYAKKYLAECMDSLRKQDYKGETKIFITDNETTTQSFQILRNLAGEAELILNKDNDGFAKGCNDSVRQALGQDFGYFFIINMDTVLSKDCLRKMIEAFEASKDKKLFLQPRIMLNNDRNKINSLGNMTHFLGFGYCLAYNESWGKKRTKHHDKIMYPSGSAIFFSKEALLQVGLFDEKYWMYNEDQDLGWRAWLYGYECRLVPEAVVYHKYEFAKSIKQYYYMDRNRIISILKNYKLATLVLIFPAFFVMEIGLFFFALKNAWLKEKIKVWKYFLSFRTWSYIAKARREIGKKRQVKDKKIANLITGYIWYQELDDWKLKLINPFFSAYWFFARLIIFW